MSKKVCWGVSLTGKGLRCYGSYRAYPVKRVMNDCQFVDGFVHVFEFSETILFCRNRVQYVRWPPAYASLDVAESKLTWSSNKHRSRITCLITLCTTSISRILLSSLFIAWRKPEDQRRAVVEILIFRIVAIRALLKLNKHWHLPTLEFILPRHALYPRTHSCIPARREKGKVI